MKKKFSKVTVTVLAAIAIAASLIPAPAITKAESVDAVQVRTITTQDGVLSVDVPVNGMWTEMADPNYYFTISDGTDIITVDHLSNGESLPQVQVAGNEYAGVYQAFVSTRNEVFVVKALATQQERLQSMMEIIGTLKVLKFDTKTALTTPAPTASEFALREINATYYVSADKLNVRAGCSTNDALVGTLSYGDAVTVKGAVTRNGEDYGWYQISYNGSDAYASAGFFSANPVVEKKAESSASAGGYTIYLSQDGTGKKISVTASSPNSYVWVDNEGTEYQNNGDLSFTDFYGNSYTLFDDNGLGLIEKIANSTAEDYNDDAYEEHYLVGRSNDLEMIVGAGGGGYYDENGMEYQWVDGETMTDANGNLYDVIW